MLVSPRRSYPENFSQIEDQKFFFRKKKSCFEKKRVEKKRVRTRFFFGSKSSLKLHGGRRPPKKFFTRVPPMLIFTQVARRRRAKNFYKGPPYVIFSSYKNLKVSTQVTWNFGLDRGGLVTKFWRFTNMYGFSSHLLQQTLHCASVSPIWLWQCDNCYSGGGDVPLLRGNFLDRGELSWQSLIMCLAFSTLL